MVSFLFDAQDSGNARPCTTHSRSYASKQPAPCSSQHSPVSLAAEKTAQDFKKYIEKRKEKCRAKNGETPHKESPSKNPDGSKDCDPVKALVATLETFLNDTCSHQSKTGTKARVDWPSTTCSLETPGGRHCSCDGSDAGGHQRPSLAVTVKFVLDVIPTIQHIGSHKMIGKNRSVKGKQTKE